MKSLLLYEKQLNILFYYIHKIGICKYFTYSFQKIFTDTSFCNMPYIKVTFSGKQTASPMQRLRKENEGL